MNVPLPRTLVVCLLIASTLLLQQCGTKPAETVTEDPLKLSYTLRAAWPHDIKAYTQGFVVHNGQLYESTGQEGASWIGLVDVKTGIADKKVELRNTYFGEGITILHNKIYQLTWTTKVGFVYDLKTFAKLRDFDLAGEGWGITHDNANLILSDGSDQLSFLDTTTLEVTRKLKVKDETGPVTKLNELEYINGFVYANVWQTNIIVKIDPATGTVVGRLDLTPLAAQARNAHSQIDVLNGIAWHADTGLMLVTGKYWPYVYVLKLNETKKPGA
ncbi:MAG: glutaminyl-peptide cyclotransferase [Cyclobacteriaceae bacterium]|nr:glutaminyl-peptide cyclotransferase [Cyclobacteriaceae bacterium]